MNWDSLKGLSSGTWGRLWLRVRPRSAMSSATGLLRTELPRSAWMVSPDVTAFFATVSAISRSAKVPLPVGEQSADHVAAEHVEQHVHRAREHSQCGH